MVKKIILKVIVFLKLKDNILSKIVSLYSHKQRFKSFNKNAVRIGRNSVIQGDVKIGYGTSIKSAFIHGGVDGVEIGRYCAIAYNLRIRPTNHSTQFANLQSYFLKLHKIDHSVHGLSKGKIKIGHNVWLGDNIIILPGVSIGNGAIVGAGSIVTKDIPAYSMAVGNPAKVIKNRFDVEMIEFLEVAKWWDWSDEKIKANHKFFKLNLENTNPEEIEIINI